MGQSRNRRATTACIILFCTALGLEIILFVKLFYEIRPAPVIPMLLSFVFWEIRKRHGGTAAGGRRWKNSCSSMW